MPLKKNLRQMLFWVLAFTLLIAVYQNVKSVPGEKQIPYSEFKLKLKAKGITKVLISPDLIKGEYQ